MTENDERRAERELEELRGLLRRDVEVPFGMVARLQAAVQRESSARAKVDWQARLAIACLFYIVLGLWSSVMMTIPLAILFGVIAMVYPWAVHSPQE